MKQNERTYWMALAHAKSFTNRRKMEFIIAEVFEKQKTISEVLDRFSDSGKTDFDLSDKEKAGLIDAVDEFPNWSFTAEELEHQNIRLISVLDPDYPQQLKRNLGKSSPILIYIKGNPNNLHQKNVAIVGSRKCSDKGLNFTDQIAKKVVSDQKIVVSGFAKGIDQQALNSALKYEGKSIIVLPQGILSYTSTNYYKDLVKGNVSIISTYSPKAPWSVGLAMDRNKTIYGLADEIYVAESDAKGGTWEGVLDGLRKGRNIFIRYPESGEKNANILLIQKGAKALQFDNGNLLAVSETDASYSNVLSDDQIIGKVYQLLENMKGKGLSSSELIDNLNLDKAAGSLTSLLKNSGKFIIEKSRGKTLIKLILSESKESKLF